MGIVLNEIKAMKLDIDHKEFAQEVVVTLSIKISEAVSKINLLKAKLLKISIDQINEDTVVPFCKISPIISSTT